MMEDHSHREAELGTSATRIVTDLNGRIVEATRGAGDLLAIDERSLPGNPLDAFVARERVREFETLLFELAHGNGPVRASLRLHRPDGESLEVDVEAVAEGSGKRLEWVLAAAHREEATQLAVPDLKAVPLQRLLARLPVGVISLDSYLTVDYVNPAGQVFVEGVEVGAMLPDPLPLVSVREFAGRLFASTLPSRQVVETRDGRLLELDGIAGDKAESAVLLVQDVTSRERRSRAELEFAANAAHELRTPIAAITSALDVLKSGAEDVRADRDLFLGHIERETARLARLVEALMLLARIQTDQEQPSLRLVEAAPLLEEIAAGLEPAEGVTVHVVCPPSVAMLTDADLLRQAVWNLATNAVRYTVAGEIRLTGRDLGRMAEIEVRDTGPGIAPADRPRIFSRFYRSQRRADGGFGLGLPLSQEIARALGGSLTLDSEPGIGTRVRVHLPSARLVA
jgi:signal transduction histidine kinase